MDIAVFLRDFHSSYATEVNRDILNKKIIKRE